MLNMDDRRRLDEIEKNIREADPQFANGLRAGVATPPHDDSRWPQVTAVFVAVLACLIGAIAAQGTGLLLTVPMLGLAVLRYRARVRRSHLWQRGARWHPRW
ncbi:DUF3040 domain-containing protein [Actinokineospora sp. HUAS TT18]|uniref:DUF3040 domain-containing protein n=1 Tax=Actinokineospora sp. HUAS TT18 TaxID=3447451 RepID=UPI003F51FA2C